MNARILVVEDDPAIRAGLVEVLELADYAVITAADVPAGKRLAVGADLDLVLLDLVLPGGGDGLDVLAALRRDRPERPVIILTARGAESDRVRGLTLGADDYMVKPFGAAELLARVQAVLRRAGAKAAPVAELLHLSGCTVDLGRLVATHAEGSATLTMQEAEALRLLAARRDRAVPRDELIALLWRTQAPDLGSRAIDMMVMRLRTKLGPQGAEMLVTVRGLGYRLEVVP